MSDRLREGTFAATGQSQSIVVGNEYFNVRVLFNGAVASVDLEQSFDDGLTYEQVQTFTSKEVGVVFEPEMGVKYRLNCTSYTSGTVTYRLGAKR